MNTVDNIRHSSEEIRELAAVWPLCFQFKLQPHSRMLVAGAYKGKVIQLLADMYPDYHRIWGFDPQSWAIQQAKLRLAGYRDIVLHNVAIGTKYGTFPMGEWETDACSFANIGENARVHGEGKMVYVESVFEELGFIEHGLDLAVFNMEGYEFDLLPHLIEKDLIKYVNRMAVQFHHGFGNDFDFQETLKGLSLTHRLTVDQMPQWGYWERRG